MGAGFNRERNSQADRFRNTRIWRRKSESIQARDLHLCRVCLTKQFNTKLQHNSRRLSVHHITPIAEDYDRRLDDDNLITLCSYHHELAECGGIPRPLLFELVRTLPTL